MSLKEVFEAMKPDTPQSLAKDRLQRILKRFKQQSFEKGHNIAEKTVFENGELKKELEKIYLENEQLKKQIN